MTEKNVPLGITAKTLTPFITLNPGYSGLFHVLVNLCLGQLESAGNAPLDIVFVIDKSGSTSNIADFESGLRILDVEKEALAMVVNSIQNRETRIGIVSFDDFVGSNDCLQMTQCDDYGKVALAQFIDSLSPRNGTKYECGLKVARDLMPQKDLTRKRVMIFTSDGENVSGDNAEAIRLATEIRNDGVEIYVAGIGVEDCNKSLLNDMAGGNFRATNNANEILEFFSDAQEIAVSSAVSNGTLKIKVPNFVEKIDTFALGLRDGGLDYIAGEVDQNDNRVATVKFNTLAVGEELSFYLALKVIQREGIESNKAYSYGSLTVNGQVASLGLDGDLCQGNVKVYFANSEKVKQMKDQLQSTGGSYMNKDVDDVIKAVSVARDLQKATNTTDAGEAAKLVENARKTIAFLPKDKQFGLGQTVEVVGQKLQAGDVHAASDTLRGQTTAFASASKKAKALNTKLK
jgi:hypothetical protein